MFARVNGVRIFFDVAGDGVEVKGGKRVRKPVCFVLHGGPGADHLSVKDGTLDLAESMQIVYHDNRGSGASSRVPIKDLSLADMAGDLDGLRQHLGLRKIVLLGVSFGGMLALDYALRFPGTLSALILVVTAPSYRFKEDARANAEKLIDPRQKDDAMRILDGRIKNNRDFVETLLRLQPLYATHYDSRKAGRSMAAWQVNAGVLNWYFRRGCYDFDVVDRLHDIKVPTLIMAAGKDWICPPSQSRVMHDGIKGSRLALFRQLRHGFYSGAGHERFVREVQTFVRRHGR